MSFASDGRNDIRCSMTKEHPEEQLPRRSDGTVNWEELVLVDEVVDDNFDAQGIELPKGDPAPKPVSRYSSEELDAELQRMLELRTVEVEIESLEDVAYGLLEGHLRDGNEAAALSLVEVMNGVEDLEQDVEVEPEPSKKRRHAEPVVEGLQWPKGYRIPKRKKDDDRRRGPEAQEHGMPKKKE